MLRAGLHPLSLVEDSIRGLYPGLPLIDPAEEMARQLREDLSSRDLLREEGHTGELEIYTTGDVEEYALRAAQVGLQRVRGVHAYPPMELICGV